MKNFYPILTLIILFLIGFLPEFLLLRLDGWWKLLGAGYPVTAFTAASYLMARVGAVPQGCGMPGLILLILISPYFAGIAVAVALRLFAWALKNVPQWYDRTLDRLLDCMLKSEEE